MSESSISFSRFTNYLIDHKVAFGAGGITLGLIAATISSLALAVIISSSSTLLGPLNVLGNMSFYGVIGGYALSSLFTVSAIILLSKSGAQRMKRATHK